MVRYENPKIEKLASLSKIGKKTIAFTQGVPAPEYMVGNGPADEDEAVTLGDF